MKYPKTMSGNAFVPQPVGECIGYVRMHGGAYEIRERYDPNNPDEYVIFSCVRLCGDGPEMTPQEMTDAIREARKTANRYVQIADRPTRVVDAAADDRELGEGK